MLVDRGEVQLVAQAGAANHVGAHVERHADQQVVLDLALVVGDDLLGVRVDVLDHELGLDLDALLVPACRPGCLEAIGLVKAPGSGVA